MTLSDARSLIDTTHISQSKLSARWADLGCGDGLFTIALSQLLQPGSIVEGIDKNVSLQSQITANGVEIRSSKMDFIKDDLALSELDGILMANALHYVKDHSEFIRNMLQYLKPNAVFLIVEYDTDLAVPRWVPYPLSFSSLQKLFGGVGFNTIQKLNQRPSLYGRANIYSALVAR